MQKIDDPMIEEDIDQNIENRQFGGPQGGHFEFR